MENLQHQSERRVMSRIDAALRINYQIISDEAALNDPYDPNFMLPRYFLLLSELDQFDAVINHQLKQLGDDHAHIAHILAAINQKLNLINGALYDSMVQSVLPVPQAVNFSENGLSFYSPRALKPNTYIHLTLSHPDNHFHIATIAQVVYSREEISNYRIGAFFSTLLPQDRSKLAQCIQLHLQAQA